MWFNNLYHTLAKFLIKYQSTRFLSLYTPFCFKFHPLYQEDEKYYTFIDFFI